MSKVEITYKQVGRNLNVKIDGEVRTKVGTREELAPLKEALVAYKEKPLKKHLKAINDLLKPVTVAKEKEKAIAKAEIKRAKRTARKTPTKKVVKKEETIIDQLEAKIKKGEVSKSEIEKLKEMIGVQTSKKSSEPSPTVGRRTRGEW